MNEEYLWDKSGEPDPQIQELEEVLAPLRYQPKPLWFVPKRRNYFPLLAIAATVLIALLAGGVWLAVRTENSIPPQQAIAVEEPHPPNPREPFSPRPKPARKIRAPKRDNKEAVAAKEQLMFALRLASEKLKLARTQIRTQHKVG